MTKKGGCFACDVSSDTTFKSRVEEMASNTSMHGLPNAVRASATIRKCFWTLVALAGTGVFIWQICVLVEKFESYPTTTSVTMKTATPMRFPAVTICNINPVRRSKLGPGTSLYNYINTDETYETDAVEEIDWSALQNSTDFYEEYDTESKRTLNIYEMYTKLDTETRSEIGHQLENMLMSCSFGGHKCSPSNFSRILNYKYGNCYVFNAGTNGTTVRNVERTGPEYGLVLQLYVEQDTEYMEDMSDSVGIKVLVHDQLTMPFPEDSGYSVSTGTRTSVSLTKIHVERMEYPHGSCRTFTAWENKQVNLYMDEAGQPLGYTQEACSKTCFQTAVIYHCKCCSYFAPCHSLSPDLIADNLTTCSTFAEINCEDDVKYMYNFNMLKCQKMCPTPCSETLYNADMSSAMWPSTTQLNEMYWLLRRQSTEISDRFTSMSDTEKEKFLRGNVLKLEVFFRSMNYEFIKTEEAYSTVSLISDIGGQMGLWLGLSVLTLFEFVELFLDLISIAIFKAQRKRTVDHKDGGETQSSP